MFVPLVPDVWYQSPTVMLHIDVLEVIPCSAAACLYGSGPPGQALRRRLNDMKYVLNKDFNQRRYAVVYSSWFEMLIEDIDSCKVYVSGFFALGPLSLNQLLIKRRYTHDTVSLSCNDDGRVTSLFSR